MYTDIHILAYLQKRMTDAETADFERAVTENPALKENLEAMILAYLLHEHPDSAYSTTTPVSDDTRSFVGSLFDEMGEDQPSEPILPKQKPFYIRYIVPILVSGVLLAMLIANFMYIQRAADGPTVPKDTTKTIIHQDTNKVSSIENETPKVTEKPAKQNIVAPIMVETVAQKAEKAEIMRLDKQCQALFDANWALEKDIVQLQTDLDICKDNKGAANNVDTPIRKLTNTQIISRLKEQIAAAEAEQIELIADRALFKSDLEKCKNKKK